MTASADSVGGRRVRPTQPIHTARLRVRVRQYSPAGAVRSPFGSSSWRTNDTTSSGTSTLVRSGSSVAGKVRQEQCDVAFVAPRSAPGSRSSSRQSTEFHGARRRTPAHRVEVSSATSWTRASVIGLSDTAWWALMAALAEPFGGPPAAGPVGPWLSTAGLPVKGAALRFASLSRRPCGPPWTASLAGRARTPQRCGGEQRPATPQGTGRQAPDAPGGPP